MTLSRLIRILRQRARSIFRKGDLDSETGRELAFHIEQLAQETAGDGLTLDEARRQARRTLGNSTLLAEECRDKRSVNWFYDFWQDAQFGARMLRKNPGFTAVAALSLALGIGSNTAILGTLDAAMHGPLPFRDPDRLVAIRTYSVENPAQTRMATLPEFFAWRERQSSFESIGVSLANQADLGGTENPEHLAGRLFSLELFPLLGVQPALGRLFVDSEYQQGPAQSVVVITHRLWQSHFAGDPAVIGRQVRLGEVQKTIVGVLPEYFPYSEERVDYFLPMPLAREPEANTQRFFQVTARLKLGVAMEQAQAEMDTIAAQIAAEYPDRNRGWHVQLQPMREFLFGWIFEPLWTLEAAVVLVLLIACANVAGLLLARGTARSHEMAVRSALGAGRGRIVRQLLTESLLLSLAGGALGAVVAAWGLSWVGTVTPPPGLSRLSEVPLNFGLVSITALVAMGTGLVFGLAPALAGFRADLAGVLQRTSRPAGDRPSGQRMRGALVAGQIAIALVLLSGTGLMLKSFWRLTGREMNFEAQGMLSFDMRVPLETFMRVVAVNRGVPYLEVINPPYPMFEEVRQRLQALPETAGVAGISHPPVNSLVLSTLPFRVDGRPADRIDATCFLITPGFFATVKAHLQGREFQPTDANDAPWVAVVNETAVRLFWPELKSPADAIGKRITVATSSDERPREVVGVVRDIPTRSRQLAQDPIVYTPYTQQPPRTGPWGNAVGQMTFLVRTRDGRDPFTLAPAARRAAAEVAPDRPISNITAADAFARFNEFRSYILILGAFAGVAMLLAAIGVYGVMAHSVAQRTREIGVRVALGAASADLIRAIGRRAFVLVAIGFACGLAGAAALGQLLASQLWQVAPQDPATLAGSSLLVALVALAACYPPVSRALKMDPTAALRSE